MAAKKEKYKLLESIECFRIFKIIIFNNTVNYSFLTELTQKPLQVISEQIQPLKDAGLIETVKGTGVKGLPALFTLSEDGAKKFLKKFGINTNQSAKIFFTRRLILFSNSYTLGEYISWLKDILKAGWLHGVDWKDFKKTGAAGSPQDNRSEWKQACIATHIIKPTVVSVVCYWRDCSYSPSFLYYSHNKVSFMIAELFWVPIIFFFGLLAFLWVGTMVVQKLASLDWKKILALLAGVLAIFFIWKYIKRGKNEA